VTRPSARRRASDPDSCLGTVYSCICKALFRSLSSPLIPFLESPDMSLKYIRGSFTRRILPRYDLLHISRLQKAILTPKHARQRRWRMLQDVSKSETPKKSTFRALGESGTTSRTMPTTGAPMHGVPTGWRNCYGGPWTDEKLNLAHRIADWGLDIESQSAAAVKGMNDAVVEHNAQAIEFLNPRGHFGVTNPRRHLESHPRNL